MSWESTFFCKLATGFLLTKDYFSCSCSRTLWSTGSHFKRRKLLVYGAVINKMKAGYDEWVSITAAARCLNSLDLLIFFAFFLFPVPPFFVAFFFFTPSPFCFSFFGSTVWEMGIWRSPKITVLLRDHTRLSNQSIGTITKLELESIHFAYIFIE